MRKIRAKPVETPEGFALLVGRAATWWREHGDLPEGWNRRDVVGALIARGVATRDAMAAKGLRVPPLDRFVREPML